ncbi:hypothetical protein C8039_05085 [Halogeometricum sp. wsp3]|nr:hypothetical protein C8039_05085 [Halogeometricum sp. wsp3]
MTALLENGRTEVRLSTVSSLASSLTIPNGAVTSSPWNTTTVSEGGAVELAVTAENPEPFPDSGISSPT